MFLVLVILVALLASVKKFRQPIEKKLSQLKQKMFWSGVIKSIMLTYIKNFATFYLACRLIASTENPET